MRRLLNGAVVRLVEAGVRVFRLPGLSDPRIYAAWGLPVVQPWIERLGRMRALSVFEKARRECPAYGSFLEASGAAAPRRPAEFSRLPETTKENYVKRYSIEARCHGGRIPPRGVVIDESSGSSGAPNNWVRGADERASTRRLLHHGYRLRFGDRPLIFLNCFALGPWATGMNVSMSLIDVSILKSIGPDKEKLDNTLRIFGPEYGYVLAGYPPFVKDWLDSTSLDLAPFDLHLIFGGEGCSEGLRRHFEETFETVLSSYGASDIEINVAAETELSIALRRLADERPEICRDLFGRDRPPMVFQYNPFDYLIEASDEGELIFTVLRRETVAPKIRYNLRDLGGTLTCRQAAARLAPHGVALDSLAGRSAALPFLYVFGRSDLSIPFYGAKVFPTDLERILSETPELDEQFVSFQLAVEESALLERTLVVHFERREGGAEKAVGAVPAAELPSLLYEKLREVNQDFREVSKLFGSDAVRAVSHAHGTGPFADRDRRVKDRYVAPPKPAEPEQPAG